MFKNYCTALGKELPRTRKAGGTDLTEVNIVTDDGMLDFPAWTGFERTGNHDVLTDDTDWWIGLGRTLPDPKADEVGYFEPTHQDDLTEYRGE